MIWESVHGMYVKQCVLKLSVKGNFGMLLFVFIKSFFYLLSVDEGLEFRLYYLTNLSNGRVNEMKVRYARYNEQKNCVDVTVYEAGYLLRLDCGKWKDGIKTTMNSQGSLDALAIDDPMEYVRLALDEEMQVWVDAMDDDSVW